MEKDQQANSAVIHTAKAADDEISVKELILKFQQAWRYLISKWLIILLAGIIGGLIGIGYAFYKKPVYVAATTFVLEDGNGGSGALGQYAGLASMVGVDIGGSGSGGIFSGDNIIQLYKSRTMLEKTLLSSGDFNGKPQLLINRYLEFNKGKSKWNKPELQSLNFNAVQENNPKTRLQDSVLGEVIKEINQNNLFVGRPDKKLSVIRVEVKSEDENFAKIFNDKVVTTVNDFFVQTKTKKALANVAILQRQSDSVKTVMSGAIFASASTADATPNLNPTRQILRAPIQRSQFTAEANKAILTELVKNLELSKISLRKETPLIQLIDRPVFPLEQQKPGKFKTGLIVAFVFSFLTILVLLGRFLLKNLLQEN